MTHSKLGSLSIVSVLILVAVAPALTFASAPAIANHGDDTGSYVATQGDNCVPIAVIGDGSQSVEEFYDYRPTNAANYSSHGTIEYQQSQVSQFFVYHGEEGESLVFLHDEYDDGGDGGAVSMEITGLPAAGSWVVEDDDYGDGTDDNWEHGETTSSIDWMWSDSRNDGGAFRGLSDLGDGAIAIDPAFGEESWAYQEKSSTWPHATDDVEWNVRTGEGDEDLEPLDKSQQVSIERGTCGEDETAPAASADVSPTTVAPGEDVTFDASESTDNLDVERYEWEFGDGSETVTGETVAHAYAESGTYEATLTVTDEAGNANSTTVPVTVEAEESDESPTAVLDAPESVVADESATFDASGSSDDDEIVEYQWEVDGSSVDAEGPTLERTFSDAGSHTVGVTVVDESDQTNSTAAEVTVEAAADEAPTADASADPTTVAPGETVSFDGTASTDDGEITAYEWDFGDGNTSDGATASHAYASAGDYEATLTVTDDADNTNTSTVPVTVEAEEPDEAPTAALTAPESAGIGEPVTFDAGDSTDDDEIVEYQWEIDGDSVDASGETLDQSFLEPGDHTATVTVVDGAGQNDTASANVTVEVIDDGSDEEDDSDDESDDSDESDESDDGDDSDEPDESDDGDDSDDGGDSDDSDDADAPNDGDDSDDSDDSSSGSPSSGSPSSGGSSGGTGGGAVPPADESSSASVSQSDDGRLAVTVENAAEGEAVSADVPGDENATGLRSVELVPATDADELNVTLVPSDDVSAPTGTDAGLYEVRTENGTDVANVTYQFAVDRAEVGESGELRILASDGSGASAVDHAVVENGSTTVVEATTDDVDRVVVAAVAPDVSASAIGTNGTATAGESATVEVTLANDGHADANRPVNLTVDGAVVDSRNVTVPAGETANVSFETTFDAAGDTPVSVAGTEGTVSVTSTDNSTDTEDDTATEGDAEDSSSTDTEVTDVAPTSSQNTGLALAGLGILVIGAAGLIRIL